MKRISLLASVVLAVVPHIAEARYYVPHRSRTRYSPYAFSYRSSGLIPGNVGYSPYANAYRSSGLIPDNVRYSPYAFSYRHSGLIGDYSVIFTPSWYPGNPDYGRFVECPAHRARRTPERDASDQLATIMRRYERQLKQCQREIRRLKASGAEAATEPDGKEIVSEYLRSKNIDFRPDHLIRIDGQVLSVDFVLQDKKMVLKYWSPSDIEQVSEQSGYRSKTYQNYAERWAQVCKRYKDNGWKVYHVNSTDRDDILEILDTWYKVCLG